MTANLIGAWNGTLLQDRTGYVPPKVLHALRLSIETQGSDEQLDLLVDGEVVVSTISGHIRLGGWVTPDRVAFASPIPIAGFVDEAGGIKFTLYEKHPLHGRHETVYVGQITRPQVGHSIISGNAGSSAFVGLDTLHVGYGLSTFSVRRPEFLFSDRVSTPVFANLLF
jgi:hypothetical protein